MMEIKSDPIWFNNVKKKALKESISIDSVLFIEAKFSVELKL